ncbi:MAG: hypothetical protein IMF15_00975 [Proteobacteria bacterium]|nr:hypothetical protein [Pseudomonadota bacterium]
MIHQCYSDGHECPILVKNFIINIDTHSLKTVEDQGFILTMGIAPDNASVQYVQTYAEQVEDILSTYPEYDQTFVIVSMPVENNVMAGMVLTPWSQRE